MNPPQPVNQCKERKPLPGATALTTELLILPDGRVLVHNLTQPFAELLGDMNPDCEQITSRINPHPSPKHEIPG
jgi:hypothetical protein